MSASALRDKGRMLPQFFVVVRQAPFPRFEVITGFPKKRDQITGIIAGSHGDLEKHGERVGRIYRILFTLYVYVECVFDTNRGRGGRKN